MDEMTYAGVAQSGGLGAKGKKILVTTLLFGIVFIVIGAIILASGGKKADPIVLSCGNSAGVSAEYGDVFEFNFTPTYRDEYSLYLQYASIVDVVDSYGSTVSYSRDWSYDSLSYDYAYKLGTLQSGRTYTIRAKSTTSSRFYILVNYTPSSY